MTKRSAAFTVWGALPWYFIVTSTAMYCFPDAGVGRPAWEYGRCTLVTVTIQLFGRPMGSPTTNGIEFGVRFGSTLVLGPDASVVGAAAVLLLDEQPAASTSANTQSPMPNLRTISTFRFVFRATTIEGPGIRAGTFEVTVANC